MSAAQCESGLILPSDDEEVLSLKKPFYRNKSQVESYFNALMFINERHPGFIRQRVKDIGRNKKCKRNRAHILPAILYESGLTFPLTIKQQEDLNNKRIDEGSDPFNVSNEKLQEIQLKDTIRNGGCALVYYGKAGCVGFDCDGSKERSETPADQKYKLLNALNLNEKDVLILPSWSHYKKGSLHVVVKAESDVCKLRDTRWDEGQHFLAGSQAAYLHWDNAERMLDFLDTNLECKLVSMDDIDIILSAFSPEEHENIHKNTKSKYKSNSGNNIIDEIKEKYSMHQCVSDLFNINVSGTSLFLCPYGCCEEGRESVRIYQGQVFHCFSCSEKGNKCHMDIFDLWQREKKVNFKTALKDLSTLAGVKLPEHKSNKHPMIEQINIEDVETEIQKLEDTKIELTDIEEISNIDMKIYSLCKKIERAEDLKRSAIVDNEVISSTSDLLEYLWRKTGKWFWVHNRDYWFVDDSKKLVRSISHEQIKRNLYSKFEVLFDSIDKVNAIRTKAKKDQISVKKAVDKYLNRVDGMNAVASAIDMPFRTRFFKARSTDITDSLNTSTLELAFVDDKGNPRIEDPEAFLDTFCYKRWCIQYGDALPAMLDNWSRHYYNIHHGKYKWGVPKKSWRDRIIVIIGRKDDGKTLTAIIHASLFGMSVPKHPKEWLGGATIFNEGANYPVIMYDDPQGVDKWGHYGNRFYDVVFSPVSNGILDLNIKRKFQGTVPFNGMLFAMVNNDKQENVLPDRFVTDLLDKVLLVKCVDGAGPVLPDEGKQMEEDAATLPAFYLDRVNTMDKHVLNSRYVDSHWLDPELMSESREEHGLEDKISLIQGISDLLTVFNDNDVELIQSGKYYGWKRIRIRTIYDKLVSISEGAFEDVYKSKAAELVSDYPKNKRSGNPWHDTNIFKEWKKVSELKDLDIKVIRQRQTMGEGARDDKRMVPYLLWRTDGSPIARDNSQNENPF